MVGLRGRHVMEWSDKVRVIGLDVRLSIGGRGTVGTFLVDLKIG